MARYVSGLIEGLTAEQIATTAFVAVSDRGADTAAFAPHAGWSTFSDPVRSLGTSTTGAWYVATGLFLSPTSFDPVPRIVTESRVPVAGVVFDVIPFRHPELYQDDEADHRRLQSSPPWLVAFAGARCWRSPTSRRRRRSVSCTSTGHGSPPSALVCRHSSSHPSTRPRGRAWSPSPAPTNGRTPPLLIEAWGRLPIELRRRHRLSVVTDHALSEHPPRPVAGVDCRSGM